MPSSSCLITSTFSQKGSCSKRNTKTSFVLLTTPLLVDPHQKELIQFDKGQQFYSQFLNISTFTNRRSERATCFQFHLIKSMIKVWMSGKHIHLIEKPFSHFWPTTKNIFVMKNPAAFINRYTVIPFSGQGLIPRSMAIWDDLVYIKRVTELKINPEKAKKPKIKHFFVLQGCFA